MALEEVHVEAVSPQEIGRILEVTDGLGLHRESVVVPLPKRSPGVVRRLAGGKLEIVVEAGADFESWLAELEPRIRDLG